PGRLVALAAGAGPDDHRGGAIGVDPDETGAVERRRQPVLAPREAQIDQRRRPEAAHLDVRGQPEADIAALGPRPVALGLEVLPPEEAEGSVEVLLVVAGVEGEADRSHGAGELVGGYVVLPPDLGGVHPDGGGVLVEDPLEVV